jgi:hypothetical protein
MKSNFEQVFGYERERRLRKPWNVVEVDFKTQRKEAIRRDSEACSGSGEQTSEIEKPEVKLKTRTAKDTQTKGKKHVARVSLPIFVNRAEFARLFFVLFVGCEEENEKIN